MKGRLAVVGIGPGSPDQLTQAAVKELGAAEVLVGYRAYLDQLPVRDGRSAPLSRALEWH
jgi:precorrin-3B methylase